MEVKKNDGVAKPVNVQDRRFENQKSAGTEKTETKEKVQSSVTTDELRNRVLNLQNEVKDIQTGISNKQMQIAFLNSLEDRNSWDKELKRYMKENITASVSEPEPGVTFEEFSESANADVGKMKNQLILKEVQLQNIFSSGMITGSAPNVELVKNFDDTKEIFSKLRPDIISNLLRN